ncbi:hypothetical protein [Paraburkholderia caledonica]|uniref:hypothetical protein n=1 Tax=Paraburkholderia caledonica TaxID=134536 RepID=UPI00117CB831
MTATESTTEDDPGFSFSSMPVEQLFARFDELWCRGVEADRKEMEALMKVIRSLEKGCWSLLTVLSVHRPAQPPPRTWNT